MGKIRVKTLGDEEAEKEQKKEAQKRKEAKIAESKQAKKAEVTAEKAETPSDAVKETQSTSAKIAVDKKDEKKTKGKKPQSGATKKSRSQKYKSVASLVDKNKTYTLTDALEILPKLKIATFDETVELHINTTETGISGMMTLPHGSGKDIRVVIATDAIIADIAGGKINFDVLIAAPQFMPKLAKVAKILGPKGLMPNPKNGTISDKPEEAAKKFAGGQLRFKTEAKAPVIHLTVGKLSFGGTKLSENIKTALNAVQMTNMKKVVLKSTMSPGLKLDLTKLS